MADGGGKGRSVNSQAESRKHTDECGVDGNTEQPGLRAHVQVGTEPKHWFRLRGGEGAGVGAQGQRVGQRHTDAQRPLPTAGSYRSNVTEAHIQVVKIKRGLMGFHFFFQLYNSN